MPSIGNALEVIEKGMEDNIYNFTKDGKCSSCGNCCSNFLPMSQKEADVIHRYIDKHHIKECIHTIPLAKHMEDWTCPFRDNTNSKCTIYEVRPEICKHFICDSEKRAKHNRKLLGQTRNVIDVRSEFYGSQGIR
jgi:Fe-S-cluster containining protein